MVPVEGVCLVTKQQVDAHFVPLIVCRSAVLFRLSNHVFQVNSWGSIPMLASVIRYTPTAAFMM